MSYTLKMFDVRYQALRLCLKPGLTAEVELQPKTTAEQNTKTSRGESFFINAVYMPNINKKKRTELLIKNQLSTILKVFDYLCMLRAEVAGLLTP